jgi:Holliday junction resolvase RusA-like endonuclease
VHDLSEQMSITFEIPGKPQGKRRARFARAGHFVKTYSDPQTVNYETFIREMFCLAHPGFVPLEGALDVEIKAFCGMPKASKKKRALMESGELRPAKKPEPDNIAKVVLDALTGLAFKNDSQVVRLEVEKWYAERERVGVSIGKRAPLDDRDAARFQALRIATAAQAIGRKA